MSNNHESNMSGSGVLNLDLRVSYELNGASLADLRERLRSAFERAVAEGDITGSSPAEVDEYALEVVSDPDSLAAKATGVLVKHHSYHPDVAAIIAKYGMMNPSDFVELLAGSEELLRGRE